MDDNATRARSASALSNRSSLASYLCYHSIADDGPEILSLPADTFERQLAFLRRRGVAGGTVRDLTELAEGRRLPRPLAFLTFDDGFLDNHAVATPLLAEYGFSAMVFVLPHYVDSGGAFDWPEVADRRRRHPDVMRSMTWPMVEALADRGIEVGSHGLRHLHLPVLSDEELREEVWDSRRAVRERLGRCDVFAYPFGEWDARVAAAVAAAGYSFAFSLPTAAQRETLPLAIPRINVDPRDRGRRFALKVSAVGRRAYLSGAVAAVRSHRRRRALAGREAAQAGAAAQAVAPAERS